MNHNTMTSLLDIEIQLQGVSISEGIAIGEIHVLDEMQSSETPQFAISKREVEHEIQRYRKAISSSREDLFRIQDTLAQDGSVEAVTIIDTHIQMLQDPYMTTMMEDRISERLQNTEAVFQLAMCEYEEQFAKINDTFFQQRLSDVKDLSSRILNHLSVQGKRSFVDLPKDAIVIAKEITVSDTAEAPKGNVRAFLSHVGSHTSHAALVAKAKGIPYVSGVDLTLFSKEPNMKLIVDGTTGLVILKPTEATLRKYEKLSQEQKDKFFSHSSKLIGKSVTKDGHKVEVLANLENVDDVHLLDKYKADGIGLFRSEYLFFDNEVKDYSEESQFQIYKSLFKQAGSKPVYFRVFDIGADKHFFQDSVKESNPALGLRSIRFLLRHRDIFRIQLRALLRAAYSANLYLLLPLITDVSELLEVKRFISLIQDDLIATGYRVKKEIKIGSMVEVPSAVMMSEFIAQESDFLSIGTNDLIQYTLAVDRLNSAIANIYQPSHPSVIRLLKIVATNGLENKTPVSLCGEMASNPLFTSLLLGLGISKLSCSPRYVPLIKQTVCNTDLVSAQGLAQKALKLATSHEVHQLLTDYYCKHHQ
ncbi:MAG: phosphoenolpyruvate--protein phosphotransferase [Rhabdochlamydiaceae bacterium]|nr:phosphoenolpyruvate--protein phosphotransferase [Candidatus Amphrikana amoebophyrae]